MTSSSAEHVAWTRKLVSELFDVRASGDIDWARWSREQDSAHPFPVYANGRASAGLHGYASYAVEKGNAITLTARGTPGELGFAFFRSSAFTPIGRLLVLRSKGEAVPRFFAHYFNGVVKFAQENTGVAQLTAPQVNRCEVAFAPLSEQSDIADALDAVDELLIGLDRLIAKKRDLKQAAMQQLLTGQTRLPGFLGEWETKRLGETASLKARIGWQGLTTAEYMEVGEFLLVTGTDFAQGYIDWKHCHFVDEARYKQDSNIQLRPRDVLVTKDGTIGKVAFVPRLPGPATLNSGVFVIRPLRGAFHPEYFYYVLCSRQFSEFLSQLAAGSTISHLYQKDFVSFTYRAPACLNEQVAIATVLSDLDAELTALEARRDKTRALKQGMMQELLTGRTRLV